MSMQERHSVASILTDASLITDSEASQYCIKLIKYCQENDLDERIYSVDELADILLKTHFNALKQLEIDTFLTL